MKQENTLNTGFKLSQNVPLPSKVKPTGVTATFRIMKVGDSFDFGAYQRQGLYAMAKKQGIKIQTTETRVWRIA